MSALREVSNLSTTAAGDAKQRHATRLALAEGLHPTQPNLRATQRANNFSTAFPESAAPFSENNENSLNANQPGRRSLVTAPRQNLVKNTLHADEPTYCTDLIEDVTDMFLERERQAVRRFNEGTVSHQRNTSLLYSYYASPHYLQYQPEFNEKMRMILIDWLIDVHLKFKLHPETMFLTINLLDRYFSCVNTKHNPNMYIPRAELQLVGVSAILLAAKYEEIWPPEVKECVYIAASTYTREQIIAMERSICTALSFRLTVPTPYPFAVRLLTVLEGTDFLGVKGDTETLKQQFVTLRHATCFFMEHALLDYKCLQFTPSQVANASLLLALATLRIKDGLSLFVTIWDGTLQHHSRAEVADFRGCAEVILEYVGYVPTTKYQAVRRKYNTIRFGEISKLLMPNEVPQK